MSDEHGCAVESIYMLIRTYSDTGAWHDLTVNTVRLRPTGFVIAFAHARPQPLHHHSNSRPGPIQPNVFNGTPQKWLPSISATHGEQTRRCAGSVAPAAPGTSRAEISATQVQNVIYSPVRSIALQREQFPCFRKKREGENKRTCQKKAGFSRKTQYQNETRTFANQVGYVDGGNQYILDLDPLKDTLIARFRAGTTIPGLSQYLRNSHKMEVSERTISARLATWNEYKIRNLDPYRESLIEFARLGHSYVKMRVWLKEQGVYTATRTLKTRMRSWGVNRRPRGAAEQELKQKIRGMIEEDMQEEHMLEMLFAEKWFVPLTTIVRLKRDIKEEEMKKMKQKKKEEKKMMMKEKKKEEKAEAEAKGKAKAKANGRSEDGEGKDGKEILVAE